MTNAEFIENRCAKGIKGAYVLIESKDEDVNEAAAKRGMYRFDGDFGLGCGWCNFKNTEHVECVETSFATDGIPVFGLLFKRA